MRASRELVADYSTVVRGSGVRDPGPPVGASPYHPRGLDRSPAGCETESVRRAGSPIDGPRAGERSVRRAGQSEERRPVRGRLCWGNRAHCPSPAHPLLRRRRAKLPGAAPASRPEPDPSDKEGKIHPKLHGEPRLTSSTLSHGTIGTSHPIGRRGRRQRCRRSIPRALLLQDRKVPATVNVPIL